MSSCDDQPSLSSPSDRPLRGTQAALRVDLLPGDLSDVVLVLTAGTVAASAVDRLHAGRGAA